ncbi:hypothetical protein C8R43DRAFT_48849 [Mycena crocata]|nr:hypothetical protein C8R43DRAFT_48849 [Mycena crocata]
MRPKHCPEQILETLKKHKSMSAPTSRHRSSSPLHIIATVLLAGVSFFGVFSRLTSGHYTPQWYAYQMARAPNEPGTALAWAIPTMDILLGILLFPRRTRLLSASMILAFFGIGLGMRVAEGKGWDADALLMALAVVVFHTSLPGA